MVEFKKEETVTVTVVKDTRTKFEKDLEAYFPEIYQLHLLGKVDVKLWTAINELLKMRQGKCYGEVVITYQDGFINHVSTTIRK